MPSWTKVAASGTTSATTMPPKGEFDPFSSSSLEPPNSARGYESAQADEQRRHRVEQEDRLELVLEGCHITLRVSLMG